MALFAHNICRRLLFTPNGPSNISSQAKISQNLAQLIERFAIPRQGQFVEKLRQIFLLNKIKSVEKIIVNEKVEDPRN